MEGAPTNHESESEDVDSRQNKKKRANIRPVNVVPAVETVARPDTKSEYENLWRRLLKNEADEPKQPESDESTGNTDDEKPDEQLLALELGELSDEQEVGELAPNESTAITERLAQARQHEVAAEQAAGTDAFSPEVAAALNYLKRVASGGEMPDDAAAVVGQELLSVDTEPDLYEFADGEAEIPLHLYRPEQSAPDVKPVVLPGFGGVPSFAESGASETAPASSEQAAGYSKSDVVGAALVGGIVGYLVGRRRGRIKTEKRLLPVQKKLEKQVKGLQENLERQEFKIRQMVAEKTRQPLSVAAEKLRGRIAAPPEREVRSTPGSPQERRRIGHVLTAAEAVAPVVLAGESIGRRQTKERASEKLDATKPAVEIAPATPLDKHVETLKPKDLLELSDKIVIEGTSLRQMYESHQIGDQALRRVVSEHLRGGNTSETLHRELTQHEIDFERDPQLRDRDHRQAGRTNQSMSALTGLLQGLDDSVGFGTEESRTWNAKPAAQAAQNDDQKRQAQQQRALKASLTAVILVLLLLVVFLVVTRG